MTSSIAPRLSKLSPRPMIKASTDPTLAASAFLLCWTQVTGLIARQHLASSDRWRSLNTAADNNTPLADLLQDSLSLDHSDEDAKGTDQAIVSTFLRLEQYIAKLHNQQAAASTDDSFELNSLQEDNDMALVGSMLNENCVETLLRFYKEERGGGDLTRTQTVSTQETRAGRRQGTPRPTSTSGGSDSPELSFVHPRDAASTPVQPVLLCGRAMTPAPVAESEPSEASSRGDASFLSTVLTSEVFNFCLDRIVEARNRFHTAQVVESVRKHSHPTGPPTLGLQPAAAPIASNRYTMSLPAAGPDLQSVRSSCAVDEVGLKRHKEALSEISSVQMKAEARVRSLKRDKLAVEEELRRQFRLARNMRTQIASHHELFRAIAELSSLPLHVLRDGDVRSAGMTETDGDNSEEGGSRGLRKGPLVASPKIPALLGAVLRNDLLFGVPIKRAVESLITLKVSERDLIQDNLLLKDHIRLLQQSQAAREQRYQPGGGNGLLSYSPIIGRPHNHLSSSVRPLTPMRAAMSTHGSHVGPPRHMITLSPQTMSCRHQTPPLMAGSRGPDPRRRPCQDYIPERSWGEGLRQKNALVHRHSHGMENTRFGVQSDRALAPARSYSFVSRGRREICPSLSAVIAEEGKTGGGTPLSADSKDQGYNDPQSDKRKSQQSKGISWQSFMKNFFTTGKSSTKTAKHKEDGSRQRDLKSNGFAEGMHVQPSNDDRPDQVSPYHLSPYPPVESEDEFSHRGYPCTDRCGHYRGKTYQACCHSGHTLISMTPRSPLDYSPIGRRHRGFQTAGSLQ